MLDKTKRYKSLWYVLAILRAAKRYKDGINSSHVKLDQVFELVAVNGLPVCAYSQLLLGKRVCQSPC